MSEPEFQEMASSLIEATKSHEKYRGECINLIASEGLKSYAVREVLGMCMDLECRYAEGENDLKGHVRTRYYQGQRYITEIENIATDLLRELLGCDWIDLRLVSGTHANLATFKGLSLATKSSMMVAPPLSCGAHISHDYAGLAGNVIGLNVAHLAYDPEEMNVDPDESVKVIRATNPGIVTLGGSVILFPPPVRELTEVAREVGAYLVEDMAHVLGLIAGRGFHDPLREGADFVTASTHKTFPGPQGGLVYGNLDDERMVEAAKKIQYSIFPLTTSNTHLARLPALGVAALEMKYFGRELTRQIIRNAKAAGEYLHERGVKVLGESRGFTESHQIVIDVRRYGGGKKVAEELEKANIILNKNVLPIDDKANRENPSGIRVGFQDVTRRGLKEGDVKHLCDLMLEVMGRKRSTQSVRKDVVGLAREFDTVKYGFQSIDEIMRYRP
ncbi:MAG: serine hydroxymethyltransferase [Candidatus Bathyarchaeia archaeon]